jgi:dephospho-CoA kinase
MLIIGLCGSSGSGKGYVCRAFATHGVAYIDTDLVYRERVLSSSGCVGELTKEFGNEILENGAVSKPHLAKIVFEGEGASARLGRLNEITHKYIRIETDALVSKYKEEGYSAVLIDAPVLFESGFDKMCDVTVCVTATQEEKLERIMDRDGITKEKAQARLSAQLSDPELRKRCTYEIDNSGGKDVDSQIVSVLKGLGVE